MASPIISFINNLVYEGFEFFGRYYSKYAGYVSDNEDPEHMGRIQVVVPGIIENESELWAWGAHQFSGKTQDGKVFGCQVLPIPGSVVWVEFEHGNPHKPIWSHGHFGQNEIPEELQSPLNHWFKTPAGHLVEMDDTENKEEIRITDVYKNVIYMTKEGISFKPNPKGKVFSGEKDKADYRAVLGEELITILQDMNTEISALTVLVSGTPSSRPINSIGFISIKTRLHTILSKINKLK